MSISSNTLFHFTRKYEILVDILREGFWPKYSKECGWRPEGKPQIAIPMVCFCDIPLSSVSEHLNFYGNYGIGVSKKWASEVKTINPVMYVNKNLLHRYNKIFKQEYKTEFISRIKPISSWNFDKDNNLRRNYAYYDEREWRYIPDEIDAPKLVLSLKKFTSEEEIRTHLNEINRETEKYKILPDSDAIKYIIIAKEEERLKIIKDLDKIFASKLTSNDLQLLKSRIITQEQIENDF